MCHGYSAGTCVFSSSSPPSFSLRDRFSEMHIKTITRSILDPPIFPPLTHDKRAWCNQVCERRLVGPSNQSPGISNPISLVSRLSGLKGLASSAKPDLNALAWGLQRHFACIRHSFLEAYGWWRLWSAEREKRAFVPRVWAILTPPFLESPFLSKPTA